VVRDLLNMIIESFETQLGLSALSGDVVFLGGEAFVTVRAPNPTPAMHTLAREIEREYDELGLNLHLSINRVPSMTR
jgi:hypothetical protein